jgi:uncharacterized protein (DUF1697 family)
LEDIFQLVDAVPEKWTHDALMKTDVIFLWKEIVSPDILNQVIYDPKIEKVLLLGDALVWNVLKVNTKPGSVLQFSENSLLKMTTVRNISTVRKI